MPISLRLKATRWPVLQFFALLILVAIGIAGLAFAQQTATHDRIYVVTHVDVLPQAPVSAATTLLKQYAADSRKENGAVRIEVYAQISRLNHFSMVEVWQDQKSFEAHEAAAHTKQFRDQIQPMLGSPFDERLHQIVE